MTNYTNDQVVERIKDTIDIVDFISGYVKLDKSGANYVGLCPFHNEKTPSFTVSENKNFFHCFGCGAGGDVLEFAMKKENLSFPEAIKFLGDRYGIEVEEQKPQDLERQNKRNRSYEINRVAAKFFLNNLMENEKALSYLNDRGIDNKTIRSFGLGYALDGWEFLHNYLKEKGYDSEELEELGLVGRRSNGNGFYDKFRNRIIFPIIDTRSRVIGFGGRVLDDTMPKYLNSQETLVFHKGTYLYGLNSLAKSSDREKIILVEGYMDVISLYNHEIDFSVASLGTALTETQVKLLKRYGDQVYICYDSDLAGIKATEKAISLFLKEDVTPKIIMLGEYKDPDDFFEEKTTKDFKRLIDEALHFIDYKIHINKEKYNLDDIEGKIKFTVEVARDLRLLKNPIEVDVYINKLSEELNISKEAIEKEVFRQKKTDYNKNQGRQNYSSGGRQPNKRNINYNMSTVLPKADIRAETELIKLMILDKQYYEIIDGQNIIKDFQNHTCKEIVRIIEDIYFDEDYIDRERIYKIIENKANIDFKIVGLILSDEITFNSENIEQMLSDLIRTLNINKLQNRRKDVRNKIKELDENKESLDVNVFSDLLKELTFLNEELENIRCEDRG